LVAHNLNFDAGFLAAEFGRVGITMPYDAADGLCTMQMAAHFLPTANRSLQDCCRVLGLPEHRAHSALHDAQAAAQLLASYLTAAGTPPPWAARVGRALSQRWPEISLTSAAPVQRREPGQRQEHFLARLIEQLPRARNPKADSYLDLLDRALLDRHISESEADELVTVAEELGLWRADVARLHEDYLEGLAAVALEDEVLTPAEHDDLRHVALLLGLEEGDVARALAAAADGASGTRRGSGWRLRPDDLVVFTGTMERGRAHWEETARSAGLRVGDAVTKKTRLVVAADPDSMSGKAKKARQYDIPIVHTSGYLRLLKDL
jgi:DNA polymerase-3 subunit epsilon